jgi:hypothetical protein
MTEVTLGRQTYRRIDTASKLLGLAFAVAGLEVGPASVGGGALLAVGIVLATITVFIETNE